MLMSPAAAFALRLYISSKATSFFKSMSIKATLMALRMARLSRMVDGDEKRAGKDSGHRRPVYELHGRYVLCLGRDECGEVLAKHRVDIEDSAADHSKNPICSAGLATSNARASMPSFVPARCDILAGGVRPQDADMDFRQTPPTQHRGDISSGRNRHDATAGVIKS